LREGGGGGYFKVFEQNISIFNTYPKNSFI